MQHKNHITTKLALSIHNCIILCMNYGGSEIQRDIRFVSKDCKLCAQLKMVKYGSLYIELISKDMMTKFMYGNFLGKPCYLDSTVTNTLNYQ